MQDVVLMNGDCLELMQQLPNRSIDMILCDLPYGKTACKWDVEIPVDDLWKSYRRIAKPNAAIVLFGMEPFSSTLRLSNAKMYKYDWVWQKPHGTGFLNAKKQPLRDVEYISVFYEGQCKYNPQFCDGEPYKDKDGKKVKVYEKGKTVYGRFMKGNDFRNENPGIRYPKQVIRFGVVERATIHPTQKPVPLLEYLIRTYTDPGDTVLDNCMGSGSTGVACINTGRKFIGMEIDSDYFQKAQDRIHNTSCQTNFEQLMDKEG